MSTLLKKEEQKPFPTVTLRHNGTSTQVADANGWIWRTHDLYETAAIVSLFTMDFGSVLALIKLIGSPARPRATDQ